ncbi:MAG: ATP-binding cassette domain-containing protein [Bacteroidetes bacterium]|nr:ATP-binding cassette domain-containing protein [Bacteroidota bacterium]
MKPILEVQNLWKSFQIGAQHQRYLSMRESLTNFAKHGFQSKKETFWALKDLNFNVYPGETLGIIGRNGAGKTTLLKILSRISPPTKGSITVRGRMASLLEVGTGFHTELTGRENIFLNGAILGLSREEIKKKYDEIVEFSGVEKFLETPLKHFSSGMQLRLAFAVAAHLEPEILLIDEVLAVGDAEFQKRCMGKMDDIAKSGKTVIFVSHNINAVKNLCNSGLLIMNGTIQEKGDLNSTINKYLENLSSNEAVKTIFTNKLIKDDTPISIIEAKIIDENNKIKSTFDVFEDVILSIKYQVNKETNGGVINFELFRFGEQIALSFDTDLNQTLLNNRKIGLYKTQVAIPRGRLKPGNYAISIGCGIANVTKIEHFENCLEFEVVLESQNESLVSYASKRSGIIALPLHWQTKSKNDEQL